MLPDTPTMRESGFPDFSARNANLIFVPKGLSDDDRSKAQAQLEAIRTSPSFSALLEKLGMETADIPSAELPQWVQNEGQRWHDVIKQSGLKVD